MTELQKLIYKMLTTNTGIHMLDSGGGEGRAWQRNQKKTIQDFINEPQVSFDLTYYDYEKKTNRRIENSSKIEYTISTFHYLTNSQYIDMNDFCRSYNALACKDWDSDIFAVSKSQKKWLDKHGFEIGESFNTYNGETSLSQVLQGTYIKLGANTYVLLQIHNGADVRGGYTDAKMFYLPEDYMPQEDVFGSIGETQVENTWDGITITDESGNSVAIKPNDTVQLYTI